LIHLINGNPGFKGSGAVVPRPSRLREVSIPDKFNNFPGSSQVRKFPDEAIPAIKIIFMPVLLTATATFFHLSPP